MQPKMQRIFVEVIVDWQNLKEMETPVVDTQEAGHKLRSSIEARPQRTLQRLFLLCFGPHTCAMFQPRQIF